MPRERLWLEDIRVLYDSNFIYQYVPLSFDLTPRSLNALMRCGIFIGGILFLYSKNLAWLSIPFLIATATYFLTMDEGFVSTSIPPSKSRRPKKNGRQQALASLARGIRRMIPSAPEHLFKDIDTLLEDDLDERRALTAYAHMKPRDYEAHAEQLEMPKTLFNSS